MTCPATGALFCATDPWTNDGRATTRTCPDCGATYTYRPPTSKRPSLADLQRAVEAAEADLEDAVARWRDRIAEAAS